MQDTLDVDPVDPNFTPPTRPASALSSTSDASYFELYEDSDSADVDLPRRTIIETIRRYGGQCLLCGSADDLVVTRAVLQHVAETEAGGEDEDPISLLKALGLLPPEYSRDDWTNLMTLCRPHAQAYDEGVWRWVPGAMLREEMANASPRPTLGQASDVEGDVAMVSETHFTMGPTSIHAGEGAMDTDIDVEEPVLPAETLVDDGNSDDAKNPEINFQPVELLSFDVLVFRPDRMPFVPSVPSVAASPHSGAVFPASITMTAHEDAYAAELESASGNDARARVWRDWRGLVLNPYIALASAFPVFAAGPESLSLSEDPQLRQTVEDCLTIRARWAVGADW